MWNRLGNVAGQVPLDDRDVDFLPATKALHDAGFTCCCTTSASTARASSGKRPAVTSARSRSATSSAPSTTCARRADVDGAADRLARDLDGRQIALLRRARVPADQGDPRLQPAKVHVVQRQLLRWTSSARSGPLIVCADRADLPARAHAAAEQRSTRATRRKQARRHDRQVRPGHRRPLGHDGRRPVAFAEGTPNTRRPGRALPLDRPLRRLPLRVRRRDEIADFFTRTL